MFRPSPLLWAVLSCIAVAGPARAQAIGDATAIVRDVRGVMAGRVAPLTIGDTIYRDQILRTAAESSAVVTFLDKTGMALGPQSEVRLDDFVFSPRASGPRTVDAMKGLFRFISGPGGAHDYQVRTPHATIAVRGTTFDVRVTAGETTVALHEGAVDVCASGTCQSLRPGQTLDATRSGTSRPRAIGPADWSFSAASRPQQKAALEAAQTALARRSEADHAAHARKAKAAAELSATRLAAAAPAKPTVAAKPAEVAPAAAPSDAGVPAPTVTGPAAGDVPAGDRIASSAAPDAAPSAAPSPAPSAAPGAAPAAVPAAVPGAAQGAVPKVAPTIPAKADVTPVSPSGSRPVAIGPVGPAQPTLTPPPSDPGHPAPPASLAARWSDRLAAAGRDALGLLTAQRRDVAPARPVRQAIFVLPPSAPRGTVLAPLRLDGPNLDDAAVPRGDPLLTRPTRDPLIMPATPGPELLADETSLSETPLWSVRQRVRDGPPTQPG